MMNADFDREGATPIAQLYDEISRTRPLSDLESRRLERALKSVSRQNLTRRFNRPSQNWYGPWDAHQDALLLAYLFLGYGPAQIHRFIGRTERSVWRRMSKKGWSVRAIAQGSMALGVEGRH